MIPYSTMVSKVKHFLNMKILKINSEYLGLRNNVCKSLFQAWRRNKVSDYNLMSLQTVFSKPLSYLQNDVIAKLSN